MFSPYQNLSCCQGFLEQKACLDSPLGIQVAWGLEWKEVEALYATGRQSLHNLWSDNTQKACLLQVPLGVVSFATFHVVNQGYDNLELKTRLPADSGRLPLSLTFPEGNIIGERV
jgi:hypothetical protein